MSQKALPDLITYESMMKSLPILAKYAAEEMQSCFFSSYEDVILAGVNPLIIISKRTEKLY